ncbi:diguanylate cyclase [Aurantivibrio infirmus]
MNHIHIIELMTTGVKSVSADESLDKVLTLMREHVYSCMVVVENDVPVGIITERDMVKILSEVLSDKDQSKKILVKDVMSSPPICLDHTASLYEALVITQTRNIRHIPIVNENNILIGLVTQSDIAKAHFMAIEKQRDAIELQIRDRTRELSEANEELKALALQDGLLDIGNRRAMEVDIHFTHSNALRYHHSYAAVLLDVDYFKKYNDFYGHQAGDDALKAVANSIKNSIRRGDRLYRYGGEEFLVLMPEATIHQAVEATKRIIETLAFDNIPHEKSPYGRLSISAGIGTMTNNDKDAWEDVVAEADEYLYQAKEHGRDQVCWNTQCLLSTAENSKVSSIQ